MKMVFIDPKGVWEGLNNGIAYIAAGIGPDHEIRVIDFVNKQGDIPNRMNSVKDADFVGISVKSFTLEESIMAAKMSRE